MGLKVLLKPSSDLLDLIYLSAFSLQWP